MTAASTIATPTAVPAAGRPARPDGDADGIRSNQTDRTGVRSNACAMFYHHGPTESTTRPGRLRTHVWRTGPRRLGSSP
ncbi:hypothetical protein Ae406Ps2_5546c [Pseudonocardia sp. Ae406_Ps2]|nr:hypothetical protein Ae331Ps2_0410 [Pseudonocardia sp. Ae331_Ps2]OLM05546.1 hypothetical protein Ae406Ps2_5546c [Pseudonocardia sp. Ae406_Ps2]OLM27117.1 hypothetical protein Ae706Ps2_5551c [Pseudonocardia sp. Ae706_Ps2]